MKSSETRIRLVHQRAKELQKESERKKLRASASASFVLCIALIAVFCQLDLRSALYAGSHLTGSSLLSENVGGYVLVGVAAFMSGVIITVVIRKRLVQKHRQPDQKNKDNKSGS